METQSVSRVRSLVDLRWPDGALIIADAGLPARILTGLPEPLLVDSGEDLKTLTRVGELAEEVLSRRATRPMTLVAVGGGALGDAVGFLASILWRGVPLWHVPTTLLAMVDSAHGGKTAVNLGQHKNQLGTFWSAERVVLVEDLLETMPTSLRVEGYAELLKALWLGDGDAVALVDALGPYRLAGGPFDAVRDELSALLSRAIAVKRRIVREDPREEVGTRTLLNLGHTCAHGLELHTNMPHGRAVGWGMAAAAFESLGRGHIDEPTAEQLLRQIHPVLREFEPPSQERFAAALGRDKKSSGGRLRSILIQAPGECFVTHRVTAVDWYRSLRRALDWWKRAPLEVMRPPGVSGRIRLGSSKSELNRILAIAALRPGPTEVVGHSECDDVVNFRNAMVQLQRGEPAHVGDGGTTFRFLAAVCAARYPGSTLVLGPQLARRPHGPLLAALRSAGAEVVEEGSDGVRIGGLPSGSLEFVVESTMSSQFASALALLSAAGRRVTLRVSTRLRSRGYFTMTLDYLRQAGVNVAVSGRDHRLVPTDRLSGAVRLEAEADASSAAFWLAVNRLGGSVVVENPPGSGRQPDQAVDGMWWASGGKMTQLDISETPDLAPILIAAAAVQGAAVQLVGAPHLRAKESNRIEDLVSAFAGVGVRVSALDDGLKVESGPQVARSGASFDPKGDHRLAMASVLLAHGAELRVANPWVVAKSYPELWYDLASVGALVRVVSTIGGAG